MSSPPTLIHGWASTSETGKIMTMLDELKIEYSWDNSGTVYPDLINYGYDLVMLSGDDSAIPDEGYMMGFYNNPDGEEPYEYVKTKTTKGMKAIIRAIIELSMKIQRENPTITIG